MTQYLEQVKIVIEQIYAYDYFVQLWESVKHTKPLEECTREELLQPFQRMWEALPDSSAIRREPFFAICNLAEDYCFNDDD